MTVTYPRIDDAYLTPVRGVALMLKKHPTMLDDPACPYSHTVRDFLRKSFLAAEVEAPKTSYSEDDLEAEVAGLYSDLKKAGLQSSVSDPKDKIALLKTSADLLTRMVALKERLFNIKSMSQFQKTTIEILEAVCTPAQRTDFIERLSQYVQATSTAVLGQGVIGDPAASEGEGPGA